MGGAADLDRLQAHEAAHPVVLVHDQVPDLQVAEVGEEAAGAAAAAPGVEVDLLGEDVAVPQHGEAQAGQLEAAGQGAHPGEDPCPVPHREAVLAEHVLEAVGPAGVPQEEDRRPDGGSQVVGEAAQVARVGGDGAGGEVDAALPGVDLAGFDGRALGKPLHEPRAGNQALLRRESQLAPASHAVFASALHEGLGLGVDGLRLDHHHRAAAEVLPCGHGGVRNQRQQLDEALGHEAPFQALQELGPLAPGCEALGDARAKRFDDGAGGEDVREGKGRELVERGHGALGLRVEGAEALHRVAEELQADRGLAVAGEDVEDAAAAGHLAGRGHRILPHVAALVERLEENLGGHFVPRAHGEHARLEQVRSEAGAEEGGRRGHEGQEAAPTDREQGSRAPEGGVGVARQASVGRRTRGREGVHRPREAGGHGQRAQVLGELVDVFLPWHHHERGRFRQQQRHEAADRSDEAGDGYPARAVERLFGFPEPGGGAQAQEGALGDGPVASHPFRIRSRIPLVERPGRISTRTTRPPAPSTSSRPTIWSRGQSAPFTSTSGRTARMTSIGVGSS